MGFKILPKNEVKSRLRSQKLLERLEQKIEEKQLKDKKICAKISRLAVFKKAGTVMFYLPIHSEVDLIKLFEKYQKTKKFILPLVKKKSLKLFYVENLEDTQKGSFNLLEPKKHLPKAEIEDIEVILVPGTVFSENGHRIGYGKGFYDRLLKKATATKIGVAYEFQMVKNIPGEVHDVPMDMIITETSSFHF